MAETISREEILAICQRVNEVKKIGYGEVIVKIQNKEIHRIITQKDEMMRRPIK